MTSAAGAPSLPPQSDDLHRVAEILYRRRLIVVCTLFLTMLVATVIALVRPVYEASSTLLADKTPPFVLLASSQDHQQPLAQAPDVFTLAEITKSDSVRAAAAARLAPPYDPGRVKKLLARMRVRQVKSTDLVRVSVRDRDPRVAAAAANAVADAVIAMDLSARRRQGTVAREFIGGQLETAGRELRTRQHALAAFKKENHDVSLSDETQLRLRELADLEAELTGVHLQQQQAQAGFARPVSAGRGVATQELADPVITSLQSQLATLEVEYSGLRQQFTSLHPQVISTQARIQETQKRLVAELGGRRTALDTRERNLTAEIARLDDVLVKVPSREAMLARLTIESSEAERTYLLLSQKFQEARIAEGSIGSAVRIIDAANAFGDPVWRIRTILVLGGFLGLLLGTGGAYAAERFDTTVKSTSEVEQILGAPVLGSMPFLPSDGMPGGKGEHPARLPTRPGLAYTAHEAFRVVRTHVLQSISHAQAKSVVMTSAHPRHGTTTVAANLAISVAQTDRRVWLVDCNFRQPALGRLFPEVQSPGLSAFLAGRAGVEDVVRPTTQPRLQCVINGAEVLDPSSLLDTQLMTAFLDQARERADVIFLDCPAVDGLTDPEVIGMRADATIFVVEVGRTDRLMLLHARQRLKDLGVHVIGAILNQRHDGSRAKPTEHGVTSLRRVYARLRTKLGGSRTS